MMSMEEFAQIHGLPPQWLTLRSQCAALVDRPEFWYKTDLQNEARLLATEASNILQACRKARSRQDAA